MTSKYHREKPTQCFSPNQIMYNLVKNHNKDNKELFYSRYLGENTSFEQLFYDTDGLAAALYADGVSKDSIVGVCLLTTPEVCPVLLAVNKIGAVSYWMDARLKSADLQKYISSMKIEIMVVFEALIPVILELEDRKSLRKVIVVKANPLLGIPDCLSAVDDDIFVGYQSYIQNAPDIAVPLAEYEKNRTTVIVQSSGSTGKSKSLSHTDYNFNMAVLRMAYCDLPFYPKKRALVCAPPWVIYGLVNSIYSGLVFGIQTIFTTQHREDLIYSHLGQFDIAYGVPVHLRFLYSKITELKTKNNEEDQIKLNTINELVRNVDVFISGGDKVAEKELLDWQLSFDNEVLNGYGNNEVTGAVIVNPRFANRPGSIGIPMQGIVAKTIDEETGMMHTGGERGELCIHSDALFKEYYNDQLNTSIIKQIHDGKEWIHTGDLATIDDDGFVYLLGRTRRLIIDKLGYKISPENSENVIMTDGDVVESVVVGAEIAENDTVPVAFIEFVSEKKNDDNVMQRIKNLCIETIKDYERPKYFFEIEHIPHKENGGKRDFLALEKLAEDLVKGL